MPLMLGVMQRIIYNIAVPEWLARALPNLKVLRFYIYQCDFEIATGTHLL
jgi:hypothetical protein